MEQVFRRHGAASLASDPLQFPRRFADPADQEVAAFLAASLAFGNARSIVTSLERVFRWTGPRPARFVSALAEAPDFTSLDGFRHRWIRGRDVVTLGRAIGRLLARHGSLQRAFATGIAGREADRDLAGAIERFRGAAMACLGRRAGPDPPWPGPRFFFSSPRTSAAKRTAMFLRWMVRGPDDLDLGLWRCLRPSELVVPLDVHMFRIARRLRLTSRRTPGWGAALDLTRGLALLDPEDPTKYDFALSRLGIVEGCPRHARAAPCELCRISGS